MQEFKKSNTQQLQEKYQVKLFYGWEEGECGIYHAFKAVDPNADHNDDQIGAELAEQLDREPKDDNFDFNSMYVNLPESLIKRIRADAVQDYCRATLSGKPWEG